MSRPVRQVVQNINHAESSNDKEEMEPTVNIDLFNYSSDSDDNDISPIVSNSVNGASSRSQTIRFTSSQVLEVLDNENSYTVNSESMYVDVLCPTVSLNQFYVYLNIDKIVGRAQSSGLFENSYGLFFIYLRIHFNIRVI